MVADVFRAVPEPVWREEGGVAGVGRAGAGAGGESEGDEIGAVASPFLTADAVHFHDGVELPWRVDALEI